MYAIDEAITRIYRKHTDFVAARNLPWETPIPLTKAAEIQLSVAPVSARNLTACGCLPWAFTANRPCTMVSRSGAPTAQTYAVAGSAGLVMPAGVCFNGRTDMTGR